MNETIRFLAQYDYWLLLGAILGRQACLPIPANLVLVAAGALARSERVHGECRRRYPRNQMPAHKQPNNSAEIRSTAARRSQRPCGVDTALSSRLISSSKLVNIALLISSSCKLYVASAANILHSASAHSDAVNFGDWRDDLSCANAIRATES
jgi:hypothetical protein